MVEVDARNDNTWAVVFKLYQIAITWLSSFARREEERSRERQEPSWSCIQNKTNIQAGDWRSLEILESRISRANRASGNSAPVGTINYVSLCEVSEVTKTGSSTMSDILYVLEPALASG